MYRLSTHLAFSCALKLISQYCEQGRSSHEACILALKRKLKGETGERFLELLIEG